MKTDINLEPCGCGKNAYAIKHAESEWVYKCLGCAVRTMAYGKQEEARNAWNRAMSRTAAYNQGVEDAVKAAQEFINESDVLANQRLEERDYNMNNYFRGMIGPAEAIIERIRALKKPEPEPDA